MTTDTPAHIVTILTALAVGAIVTDPTVDAALAEHTMCTAGTLGTGGNSLAIGTSPPSGIILKTHLIATSVKIEPRNSDPDNRTNPTNRTYPDNAYQRNNTTQHTQSTQPT